MDNFTFLDILMIILGLYLINDYFTSRRHNMPPGPTPWPIVGNLLDMPKSYDWLHWAKHKDLYGPISSVTVFGQNMVILNEAQIAFELLEKRSPVYSDRPSFIFAGEMCGWARISAFLRCGARHRAHRKNIYQVIGSKRAISHFHPLKEVETRRMLSQIADSPEKLYSHIRTFAGAVILKITYGYTIRTEGRDTLVDLANEAMEQVSEALIPGAWLVDALPTLRRFPEWLPGIGFKITAQKWHKTLTEMVEKPHAFVKRQMALEIAIPSYTSSLIEKTVTAEEEDDVKWSATSMFAGGADTTVSAIYSFFLAMTLYPEIQKKAQAELDAITGGDRLPTFEDRPQLPYIEAVVKEVLRWHPVTPLNIPHVNTDDDIYNGYFIPKGTLLVANIWQMTQDPTNYHEPTVFNPDRFLGVNGRAPEMDTHNLIFGFGRRICAGKEFADSSIFITVAMSLAVFNIVKSRDCNGTEIEPLNEVTSSSISHTKEFECSILPRSAKAVALIRSVNEEHPPPKGDADELADLVWESK